MSSLDVLHVQGTSCEIVLIFECTQNMEIGMKRYTAVVSQIAGIAPFIRVKEFESGLGVGRLPSSEVNTFSRYIVESPAQSLGIIRQMSLSLRRLFCWERERSLPYKILISLQVLVLFFTTVMF